MFVVKYQGKFGFIKPWTAVRDGLTYSQQFLTPSVIEGIEKKLFPEMLAYPGVIGKILRHKLSYSAIDIQQERTQARGWDKKPKEKRWVRNQSILNRGVMLNPVLYLAFADRDSAEIAARQHLCLCRNEDLMLPNAEISEMEEEEFKRKLFDYLSAERSDQTEIPETAERIEAAEKNETAWEPAAAQTESRPVISEENEPAAKASTREEGAVREKMSPEKDSSKSENETEDEADIWSEFEAEYEKEEVPERQRQSTESSGKRAMIETAWWIFQKLRAYFRKNHGVIRHVLRWPWRMLRSVLPRRADGRIAFGLGDPAHTGYVLSLFYLFYPENHGKIEMVPDFEKMMFVGQAAVKGRILLIEIVYYALRLIIDVRIIRLLFLIRTLKAGKAAEEEKLKKKRNQEERDSEEAVLSASAQR